MENQTFWIDTFGASISFYDAKGMRTRCLEVTRAGAK